MSGVVVTPHPTLARTLTATRAFQPGELILAEEPILTWENPVGSEGFVNFIIAFNKLNPGSKDVVRDMHCPADRASLREFAVEVCGRVEGEGVEEVLVLLAIATNNTHEYYGPTPPLSTSPTPHAALFATGSKCNHSCSPNVAYSSQNASGYLVYTAIRPIEAGGEVTFSYLGDHYEKMTVERRKILMDEKGFTCQCARCEAVDYCRPGKCGCGNWVFDGGECNTCNTTSGSNREDERMLYKMGNDVIDRGDVGSLDLAIELYHQTGKTVGYTHFLSIRLARFVSDSVALAAQNGKPVTKLMINNAARMLIVRGGLLERVAGECKSPGKRVCGCKPKHEVLWEAGECVYFGGMYLARLPVGERSRGLVETVGRYLDMIGLMNGMDVAKVTEMVEATRTVLRTCCDGCGKIVKEGELKACARCGNAMFCGRECQVGSWKAHKKNCA